MPTPQDRKALHAYLSDDAHDQWHDFAAANGVSVSAVLEALSDQLLDADVTTGSFAERLGNVVEEARKTDAARRRRSK